VVGLNACSVDLNACAVDLNACSVDLNACPVDLNACAADLNACAVGPNTRWVCMLVSQFVYSQVLQCFSSQVFQHTAKVAALSSLLICSPTPTPAQTHFKGVKKAPASSYLVCRSV
jgi:hypothetical protein